MWKSSSTDKFINFIKNWNTIKVDVKTLRKWNQIRIAKEDIQRVLKS